LASDQAMNTTVHADYTYRERVGRFDKITNSLKSLEHKLEGLDKTAIKYYGRSKGKMYWEVWEKHTGRHQSYEGFKGSWDPNSNIMKTIFTDV